MAVSEARRRANDKWDKENTEKVQFKANKGFNKMIKDRANKLGMSKAGYMKYAIIKEIKSEEKENKEEWKNDFISNRNNDKWCIDS